WQQLPISNDYSLCRLKFVNFESHKNHIFHETQGLSREQLVVRRGKPFRVTLLFQGRSVSRHTQALDLEVQLGQLSEKFPVKFSKEGFESCCWSARVYPEDVRTQSITVRICSPVVSSVATYNLLLHIHTPHNRRSYQLGTFVLLCNPWLKDDPVYLPSDVQLQEYVRSDYGLVYTGTTQNIGLRPWSFGQYEPGVLEACLKLLQVSPQHLDNKHHDYIRRSDAIYLSRVVCAMVNCNDDLGVLAGKWNGSYSDGVRPTEWSGSAEVLQRWASSNCSPVRYGQCWVFASVLCTVMRVLGIPSRVVTVFNAAHDVNANLTIEEYYSSRGEKLGLSKDSIWNFHVWVECWMRRPDLGAEFDGWQVVDPTPQEKSAGVYCCGPCPVASIQRRSLESPYDTSFIYASVDASVIRLVVRDGLVVGRTVDTELVGRLICTKSIGSDRPEDLTQNYKIQRRMWCVVSVELKYCNIHSSKSCRSSSRQNCPSLLEVSLNIDKIPSVGDSICVCVTVRSWSSSRRVLMEHVNAQLKQYDSSPRQSFWRTHKQVHIQPGEVLTHHHTISASKYKSLLANDDIVNVAVVIKDMRTQERFLAAQEIRISPPEIRIEIEGGDIIQMSKEYTALVSFTNMFTEVLSGAVLAVEGFGLLQSKHQTRLVLLQPGKTMNIKVSFVASSPGTKLLMATFSHNSSPGVFSRSFHKVSVVTE
uniref:protein-glutamine gamma-glutamyltransferase n=1 Tax=Sphaeramia orbicularis TaxID=375764 RepID=A0A673BMF9_9TELE